MNGFLIEQLGMDQEFRLGQSIRDLYINKLGFLPVNYNRTKVMVVHAVFTGIFTVKQLFFLTTLFFDLPNFHDQAHPHLFLITTFWNH